MKPRILLDDIEQRAVINNNGPDLFKWVIAYDDAELESTLKRIIEARPVNELALKHAKPLSCQ